METDYDTRLNNALTEFHGEVFDSEENRMIEKYREDCSCPICDESAYSIFCVKDGFKHKRCISCGMVYLSPRFTGQATTGFYNSMANEIYNEEKFHIINSGTEDADKENSRNLDIIINHLQEKPEKLNLLEIGSGYGFFLRKAKENGFNVHALELNKKLYEQTKEISEHIYNQDLFEKNFDDSHFDVIYMRDVIEHIHNPIPFMKELSRITKKDGLVIFDTHNIDSLVNSFTKEFHTTIFAFEHPVHWSAKTLRLAGRKVGLKHVETYYNHEGQSVREILDYILNPSFTYIFKPSGESTAFKKLLFRLTGLPGIYRLDKYIMKTLSILLGKGTTMKVILKK